MVPVRPPEPDPDEVLHEWPACRQVPMDGAHLTLQPKYRGKLPYRAAVDGRAVMWMAESPGEESRMGARCFAADARLCCIWSHMDNGTNTCRKDSGGGKPGDLVGICRCGYPGKLYVGYGDGARLLHPHLCRLPGQVGEEQLGRLQRRRFCPFTGSSNPVVQVLRCWHTDPQFFHLVHVEANGPLCRRPAFLVAVEESLG